MSLYNLIFGGKKNTDIEYNNKYFIDSVKTTNLLSNNTKSIYVSKLSTIMNEFVPRQTLMFWLLHPEDFKLAVLNYQQVPNLTTKKKLSTVTITQFFTVMISLLLHNNDIQEAHPELLRTWKKIKSDISEEVTKKYDSNEPNEKQSKAFISFDELEKIRDGLPSGSDARLLISLYTMIPPVRADFDRVKLCFGNVSKANGNYIEFPDLGNSKLVLNDFKTSKVYESITEKIPTELYQEIKASLLLNPREYLFVNKKGLPYNNRATWNIWANRILRKVLKNSNFSLTMFRHIYLSRKDLKLSEKTRSERKEISDKMGHSLDTQDKYIWKDNISIDK